MHTIRVYPDPDHHLQEVLNDIIILYDKLRGIPTVFGINREKKAAVSAEIRKESDVAIAEFRECFPVYATSKVEVVSRYIRLERGLMHELYFEVKVPCS